MFVLLGHMIGMHAPFLKLTRKEIAHVSHNVLLSHGRAVKMIRKEAKTPPLIGFAPQGPCTTPLDDSPAAIEEARVRSFASANADFAVTNAWWGDPIVLGKYPDDAMAFLGEDKPEIKPGDMELICPAAGFLRCQCLFEPVGLWQPECLRRKRQPGMRQNDDELGRDA